MSCVLTTIPTGDMSGGLVELRIPTGWTVADDAVDAVWESNAVRGEISKGAQGCGHSHLPTVSEWVSNRQT